MDTTLIYSFETGRMTFSFFARRKNRKVIAVDTSRTDLTDIIQVTVSKKYKNRFLDKLIYLGEEAKKLKGLNQCQH